MSYIIVQLDKLTSILKRVQSKQVTDNKMTFAPLIQRAANVKQTIKTEMARNIQADDKKYQLLIDLIGHALAHIKSYKYDQADITDIELILEESTKERDKLISQSNPVKKTEENISAENNKKKRGRKKKPKEVEITEKNGMSINNNLKQQLSESETLQVMVDEQKSNVTEELDAKNKILDFYTKTLLPADIDFAHSGFSDDEQLKQLKQLKHLYEAKQLEIQDYVKQEIFKEESVITVFFNQFKELFKVEKTYTEEELKQPIYINEEQNKKLNEFQQELTEIKDKLIGAYYKHLKLQEFYNENKKKLQEFYETNKNRIELPPQILGLFQDQYEYLFDLKDIYLQQTGDLKNLLNSEPMTEEKVQKFEMLFEEVLNQKNNIFFYFLPSSDEKYINFYKRKTDEIDNFKKEIKENIQKLLEVNVQNHDPIFIEKFFKALEYKNIKANKELVDNLKEYLNKPVSGAPTFEINLEDLFPKEKEEKRALIMEQFHGYKRINTLLLNKRIECEFEALENKIEETISLVEENNYSKKKDIAKFEELRKLITDLKIKYNLQYQNALQLNVHNKFSDEQGMTFQEINEICNQLNQRHKVFLDDLPQRKIEVDKFDKEEVLPKIKAEIKRLGDNLTTFYNIYKNEPNFEEILVNFLQKFKYDNTKEGSVRSLCKALTGHQFLIGNKLDEVINHLNILFLGETKNTPKYHRAQLKQYQSLNSMLYDNTIRHYEKKLNDLLLNKATSFDLLESKLNLLEMKDPRSFYTDAEKRFLTEAKNRSNQLRALPQVFKNKQQEYRTDFNLHINSHQLEDKEKLNEKQRAYILYLKQNCSNYEIEPKIIIDTLNNTYNAKRSQLIEKADIAYQRLATVIAMGQGLNMDEEDLIGEYEKFKIKHNTSEQVEPSENLLSFKKSIEDHTKKLNLAALRGENYLNKFNLLMKKSNLQMAQKSLKKYETSLEGDYYQLKVSKVKSVAEKKCNNAMALIEKVLKGMETKSEAKVAEMLATNKLSIDKGVNDAIEGCHIYNTLISRIEIPLFYACQKALNEIEIEYKRIYKEHAFQAQTFNVKSLHTEPLPKKASLDAIDQRLFILLSLYQKLAINNEKYQTFKISETEYKLSIKNTIREEVKKASQYTDVIHSEFYNFIRSILKPLHEFFVELFLECPGKNTFFLKHVGSSKTEEIILDNLQQLNDVRLRNT